METFEDTQWKDGDPNFNCHNLYSCFFYTLDYGMRLGGGLGEVMQTVPLNPQEEFYNVVFFHILFYVIINIIF